MSLIPHHHPQLTAAAHQAAAEVVVVTLAHAPALVRVARAPVQVAAVSCPRNFA